jgi:hypothetical protein
MRNRWTRVGTFWMLLFAAAPAAGQQIPQQGPEVTNEPSQSTVPPPPEVTVPEMPAVQPGVEDIFDGPAPLDRPAEEMHLYEPPTSDLLRSPTPFEEGETGFRSPSDSQQFPSPDLQTPQTQVPQLEPVEPQTLDETLSPPMMEPLQRSPGDTFAPPTSEGFGVDTGSSPMP